MSEGKDIYRGKGRRGVSVNNFVVQVGIWKWVLLFSLLFWRWEWVERGLLLLLFVIILLNSACKWIINLCFYSITSTSLFLYFKLQPSLFLFYSFFLNNYHYLIPLSIHMLLFFFLLIFSYNSIPPLNTNNLYHTLNNFRFKLVNI